MTADHSCLLTDDHKSCCCNCAHHAIQLSHPITDGKSIRSRRGWACLAPEFVARTLRPEIVPDFPEHGLCEMWRHWSDDR